MPDPPAARCSSKAQDAGTGPASMVWGNSIRSAPSPGHARGMMVMMMLSLRNGGHCRRMLADAPRQSTPWHTESAGMKAFHGTSACSGPLYLQTAACASGVRGHAGPTWNGFRPIHTGEHPLPGYSPGLDRRSTPSRDASRKRTASWSRSPADSSAACRVTPQAQSTDPATRATPGSAPSWARCGRVHRSAASCARVASRGDRTSGAASARVGSRSPARR